MRIRDYKTLVGSFQKNTLYNTYFRTNNEYGTEGDEPSDNIVIRNLNLENTQYNRILINIWSSRQIWIDHINFYNNINYDRKGNGQDDVGKFIWLNTPYESYLDKKDRLRSIDYIKFPVVNLIINFGLWLTKPKMMKLIEIEHLFYIIFGIKM